MQFVEEYRPYDSLSPSIAISICYSLYINQLSPMLNIC